MVAQADRTAVPSGQAPAATRRRGDTLEHAIYDAVISQLRSEGYGGLTMEGIAACAHTGKAALYRRWPCKEDLVVEAIGRALPPLPVLPDHGNLRDDLLDLLRQMTAVVNSSAACALQCLLSEVDRDPRFSRLVHERVLAPRKRVFLKALERAAGRGQARPEAVNQLVADVGPALVVQRFLAEGGPIPDDYLVSVVDDIVMPVLRPSAGSPPSAG
jgi:AcrR family transcriptional regulator